MNTPYPELSINLDHRIAAFAEWNAGIERSRREYEAVEFAACIQPGCTRLSATKTRGNCRRCAEENAKSARRADVRRGGAA